MLVFFAAVIFFIVVIIAINSGQPAKIKDENSNNDQHDANTKVQHLHETQRLLGLEYDDLLNEIVDFGMHQGKTWRDVPNKYLNWMLNVDDHHKREIAIKLLLP